MPTVIPTLTSHARAPAYVDDELRAPPREAKRGVPRSRKKSGSGMSRLFNVAPLPRLSTGAIVGCAAFCALMTGVVVNALYLQTDKHAAPLFLPAAEAAAPAPAPRAAPIPTPVPRPVVTPQTAPAPRAAAREVTGSLGRQFDGLDALLGGASAVKPQMAKPEAAKPQAATPHASKPQASKPQASKPQASAARSQPTKTVAEARRAAAPKPEPAKPAASKPAASKPAMVHKSAHAAPARAATDKGNSLAVTERISDEMRRKLAAITGTPVKTGPVKAKRAAADEDE